MNPTIAPPAAQPDFSLLTPQDLYLYNEGSHYRVYEKLGSHITEVNGVKGATFGVWAPNARNVFVIGSFNNWDHQSHPLHPSGTSGIWEGFIPGVKKGDLYKYYIVSHHHGHRIEKADPVGILFEKPPRTATVVWDLDYKWNDDDWMRRRGE